MATHSRKKRGKIPFDMNDETPKRRPGRPAGKERKHKINSYLTDPELRLFLAECQRRGVSQAEAVRDALRQWWEKGGSE